VSGNGINGRIHSLAGPELLHELREKNRDIRSVPSDVVITGSYNLRHTKAIIHAVGPSIIDEKAEGILQDTYRKCLTMANEKNFSSIAFPSISTGAYRFTVEQASTIAYNTVKNWLHKPESKNSTLHSSHLHEVVFVCKNRTDYSIYNKLLLNDHS